MVASRIVGRWYRTLRHRRSMRVVGGQAHHAGAADRAPEPRSGSIELAPNPSILAVSAAPLDYTRVLPSGHSVLFGGKRVKPRCVAAQPVATSITGERR